MSARPRRERPRRAQLGAPRRRSAALAFAAALAGGACGASSAAEREACPASERHRVAAWGDGERDALRAQFAATAQPHAAATFDRVDTRLRAHLDDWGRAGALACAPEPAVRECLARRAQALDATLAALRELDGETLEFAVDAAAALEPPSSCAGATGALAGARTPALDGHRLAVAQAKALARTGQVWAAVDAAREAAGSIAEASAAATQSSAPEAAAARADLAGAAIDATTLLGGLLADTGDADGALRELEVAEGWATELGDRQRLLAIANARAQVIGLRKGERAAALAITEEAVVRALALGDAGVADLALLRETRGLLFQSGGEIAAAEAELRAAIDLHARPRADGLSTPAADAVMNHLGALLISEGRDDEARELLERTVERYRLDYGERHPVLAMPLNNLGLAHQRQGSYVEAQVALTQALELQEESLGPDHPRLAATLDNLGLVARKLGAFALARESSERALELYSRSLGPDHLRLVAPLSNLGNVARERGDLDLALEHLTRALTIQEREGDDPRALAHALHDLANVHGRRGDLEAAERHFQGALELLEGALGADDPDLKGPLIGLGNVARDRGALDQARARYARALALMRRHFGDEHPEVAVALFNLGNIHKDLGRLDEAERHYRQALAIRERALRPDHPLVIKNLTTLGKLLVARGDPAAAREPLERGLRFADARGEGQAGEPSDAAADGEVEGDADGEVASLRFLLARVLWELEDERPRALELAAAALSGLRSAGPEYAPERRLAERWLSARS
ncbi:MAG: tetratricopeptide repeat protein [Nannocystaceae bacterium]